MDALPTTPLQCQPGPSPPLPSAAAWSVGQVGAQQAASVPLQSHHLVPDVILIALSGAWCFVKEKFNVDFIEKQK